MKPANVEPIGQTVQDRKTPRSAKDGKRDYAYKRDAEYLALDRYERPSLKPGVSMVPGTTVRDTVSVVDRPLTLAGRGFDIGGFPSPSGTGVEVDYLRHLKKPVPKMERVAPDPLDLQLKQAKSSKYLIFHPLRPALSQLPKPLRQTGQAPATKAQNLDPIPETRIFLKESRKSDLILRPGRESLDLLIGNETLNRRQYDHW